MSIFKAYSVTEKAKSGVWYKLRDCDAKFLLAHAGKENTPYKDNLLKALRGLPADLSEEKDREVLIECISNYIIKDWKHVIDDKGEELPYNMSNAKMLLERLPKVMDEIFLFASNYRNYTLKDYASAEEEVNKVAKK